MSLYILMTCKEMSRVFSMSMEMTGLGARPFEGPLCIS